MKSKNVVPLIKGHSISLEYRDLKTEFIQIQKDCIGKALTTSTVEDIHQKYHNLFNYFGLQDLQWKVVKCENSIVLTGIRLIDDYAIKGIVT